jgi:hypothetical protein
MREVTKKRPPRKWLGMNWRERSSAKPVLKIVSNCGHSLYYFLEYNYWGLAREHI